VDRLSSSICSRRSIVRCLHEEEISSRPPFWKQIGSTYSLNSLGTRVRFLPAPLEVAGLAADVSERGPISTLEVDKLKFAKSPEKDVREVIQVDDDDDKGKIHPADNPQRGCVPWGKDPGWWSETQCSNTACTLPRGHEGLCSYLRNLGRGVKRRLSLGKHSAPARPASFEATVGRGSACVAAWSYHASVEPPSPYSFPGLPIPPRKDPRNLSGRPDRHCPASPRGDRARAASDVGPSALLAAESISSITFPDDLAEHVTYVDRPSSRKAPAVRHS